MKKLLILWGGVAALLIAVAVFAPDTDEDRWWSGGTLHNGNIADWRNATPENRLATAADFVTALQRTDHGTSTHPDSDRFESLARQMRRCVNGAIEDVEANMRASEIGAACAIIMWGGAPAP